MKTEVVKIKSKDEYGPAAAKGAAVLLRGGLVAFPTETVYGLAANSQDPAAVQRLREIKKRPSDKPFALIIAEQETISEFVSNVPRAARKLMKRYWPGPLTLVLPSNDGILVGFRLPASDIALQLSRASGVPIAAPSANLSGDPAPCTAEEVLKAFDGDIEMVIDGGPTTLAQESTVVKFSDSGSWEVVREGIISQEMISNHACNVILFVCTGNTCRSPMAMGICKKLFSARMGTKPENLEEVGYSVRSAGTGALLGEKPSEKAVRVMKEMGIDISDHTSQFVGRGPVEQADHIFVMTRSHMDEILHWWPFARDKVRLLSPEGENIRDPFGAAVDTYRKCAEIIEKCLRVVVDEVLAEDAAG